MQITPELVVAVLSLMANMYMALMMSKMKVEIAQLKVYMHEKFVSKES